MPIELLPKDALINAAVSAERPIAFLVGSPLSFDAAGGVPGIAPMLKLIRDEVRSRRLSALPSFESAIADKNGAEAYQAAMKWLNGNFSQDAVNRVVRLAVLKARLNSSPLNPGNDGDPDEWHLPAGTRSLAELVCRVSEKYPGPLLTTNFDPLLSLAIRKIGGQPSRRIIHSDGGIGPQAEEESNARSIVHLHGYWRDSDTLHSPAQLLGERPKLKASIQRVLQQKTLVVVAYGGWGDVFTSALIELMNDEEANLDVIWCFYESDAAVVEKNHGRLIKSVASAIMRGRFRAYGGIDCHSIFAEIAAEVCKIAPSPSPTVSPLPGWEVVDADFLAALPPLNQAEAVRYFDGAVPAWRHAISPLIPKREVVGELLKRMDALPEDCGTLQLIRAAGGEGKTTVLLQAAAAAIGSKEWNTRVLWRSTPHVSLSPEQLAKLDPNYQWLLVADDAENLVRLIAEGARILNAERRFNVDFLLASRDADWRARGGDRQPWDQWLERQPDILLKNITRKDAEDIVDAWRACGNEGLRSLTAISDRGAQIEALIRAVGNAENVQEGSFFGGLLAVRFGEQGLRAHVREFLGRLREMPILGDGNSLFDALVYIAACHGTGIPGIDRNVLADLLSVPRDWVHSRVVNPLGAEAAAVYDEGHVLTRHRMVAQAVLVEAEKSFGIDLTEVWAQLVRQTVRTPSEFRFGHEFFSRIVHAGPRLENALPSQLPKDRRRTIAIAAAKASVEAEPERLSNLVDLGRTYRQAQMIPNAISIFRENLKDTNRGVDFDTVIRGYWYEWGVCEGLAGNTAERHGTDALIQGLSLSDHLNPAPITNEQVKLSCAGLGVAFGKLAQPRPDCPFARARRAVAYLGRLSHPDPKTARYFDSHDRDADEIHTPHPADVTEAIDWLTAGVRQVGSDLQDTFLADLAEPKEVSFQHLQSVLQ